jgi:hypothetical protein
LRIARQLNAANLGWHASSGATNRPCSASNLLGQTFRGSYQPGNGGAAQDVSGVLICFPNFPANYEGTLTLGFTPAGGSGADPDSVRTVAGTILHEMVHVLNTGVYQDQRNPTLFGDDNAAYGFTRAAWLAKNDQEDAQRNPDNYRIFAEMGMSPGTRWGAPKPPGKTLPAAPSTKKRAGVSVVERDEPKRTALERRTSPNPRALGVVQMNYAGELGWDSS